LRAAGLRGKRGGAATMARDARLICASAALADSGRGVRFEVEYFGEPAPAVAIRYQGAVHAYLNRCAHVAVRLDCPGRGFCDADGRDPLCSTHGATYDAATGRCVGGPCNGGRLLKLNVEERDGMVYFTGFEDD